MSTRTESPQCEYGTWNKTTNCWNYRTCSSCLETPGCQIGEMGKCEPTTSARPERNFKFAFVQNLTLPADKDSMNTSLQYWEFPATEAKYCGSDDPVCRQCREAAFWLPTGRSDNRFCVGANGCVCVSKCEMDPPYPACGKPYNGPQVNAPPSLAESNKRCRFASYEDTTGCFQLRSCKSCLAMKGCRIGVEGYCEADIKIEGDVEPKSYAVAIEQNLALPTARAVNASGLDELQQWTFPAAQVEYCPFNNAICSECVREQFWLSAGRPTDSRFCIDDQNGSTAGIEACVCVANCWGLNTEMQCPRRVTDDDGSMEGMQTIVTVIAVVSFALIAVGVGFLVWCMHRVHKRHQMRCETNVPVATILADPQANAEPSSTPYVVVRLPTGGA